MLKSWNWEMEVKEASKSGVRFREVGKLVSSVNLGRAMICLFCVLIPSTNIFARFASLVLPSVRHPWRR